MAQEEQMERLRQLRVSRNNPSIRVDNSPGSPGLPGDGFGYSSAPTPPRQRGFGRALAAIVFLCLIAGGLIGGVLYTFHQFHSAAGGPRRTVQFKVQKGESIAAIADDLQHHGLVASSLFFQLYYRINGGSENIQFGTHALDTTMSMDTIATALQQTVTVVATPVTVNTGGTHVVGFPVNFLPGKRAEEIAALLEENGIVSASAFMHEVQYGKFDYWFLKSRPAGASLDGFLYNQGPIMVTKHDSAHRIVGLMLAAFNRAYSPAMHITSALQHRSVFQIVTMASIIQRESVRAQDLPYISSVYWNRLSNLSEVAGRLSADPTVQYAMGYRADEKTWWEKYPAKIDTSIDSPYNTYKVAGLPPGPISNPDLASLKAAVYPARTAYLYFQVLSKDGGKTSHTYFCKTLDCQTNESGVRAG